MPRSPRETAAPLQRIKSSIVLRLNTKLFFRLLGIYLVMDLLLAALCLGGMLFWAEHQCADIAALVEERGVPSAEAAVWMSAGDYTVTALDRPPQGLSYPLVSPLPGLENALHTIDLQGTSTGQGLPQLTRATYTVELRSSQGQPYAIRLDIQGPVTVMGVALRLLLLFQLLSLLSNLFRNAGTIRRTLKPIQELAAAANRLGHPGAMSPEELRSLAGKLDQINATHLDTRISVPGTQKELQILAGAINAMLDRIDEAYRSQMRFVSDASHELRTPIAVIQGYANLLNRWGKDDPTTRQEAIDAIKSEADSMKELVEQLLFLARGDNDSMHIEMESFDLTEIATASSPGGAARCPWWPTWASSSRPCASWWTTPSSIPPPAGPSPCRSPARGARPASPCRMRDRASTPPPSPTSSTASTAPMSPAPARPAAPAWAWPSPSGSWSATGAGSRWSPGRGWALA